jgi:hypothetical protein
MEQASRIEAQCGQCGGPCEGWAVQVIRNRKLRWELEWACNKCGNAHDGDWGAAPTEVREPLLAEHGFYRLKVIDSSTSSGKILKAFRDALGGSLQEAKEAAEEAKNKGYYGTYIEVTLVKQFLERSDIEASVESANRDEGPV